MKDKLYYSIRVVKAKSKQDAINKIGNQDFVESHELCDKVLTESQLKSQLKKLK